MQKIITLDLEGVLIPEIWQSLARKVKIDELLLTTRDMPNYDELMTYRLNILNTHNIGIQDLQEVIAEVQPLDGALEFMQEIRSKADLIILSDTFIEFFSPLRAKLMFPTIFCNHLEINENGKIENYKLRIKDGKTKAVQALQSIGYTVLAAGDSYNDLGMIQTANFGAWFCPPQSIIEAYGEYPVCNDYNSLKKRLFTALEI